jgi:hypothetical protein
MDDLPLITRILIGALLLAAVFAAVLAPDSRRERALRSWVAKRRDARLHWPLETNVECAVPFRELVQLSLGGRPLDWGAAVQVERTDDQMWFFECRATPPGRGRADWFTLVAQGPAEESRDPEAWRCHLVDDVLSVGMLNEVMSGGASVTTDPAQHDEGVTREKE